MNKQKQKSSKLSEINPLSFKPGILYVLATPIGNLEDLTLRAIRILKEVDFIFCEDKRVTIKLLNKYQIKSQLIPFHKFNESSQANLILSYLQVGKNIALVSDAGTPLISDPGSTLISFLTENKVEIVPIPGPSALVTALSACPFPMDNFLFIGFLPSSKSQREKLITSLSTRAQNVVIYVAPHDFQKYVKEIHGIYPGIKVFYGREITKLYEEFWSGSIKELAEDLDAKKIKGEIVLCLHFDKAENHNVSDKPTKEELINAMKKLREDGCSLKEASKILSNKFDLSSKSLYDMYLVKSGSK